MSIIISNEVVSLTRVEALAKQRKQVTNDSRSTREVEILGESLSDAVLADLLRVAIEVKDTKTARSLEVVMAARGGDFNRPIPNFKAFPEALKSYLVAGAIDGWLYWETDDGHRVPHLVTGISLEWDEYDRGKKPMTVKVHTSVYTNVGHDHRVHMGVEQSAISFSPSDVVRKRIPDILAAFGLYKETAELRADYDASMVRFNEIVRGKYAEQFRVTGKVLSIDGKYSSRGADLTGRRIIHVLPDEIYGSSKLTVDAPIFDDAPGLNGYGSIPEHPVVRGFELKSHEFAWIHSDNLEPYEYDKGLRDKLVLPASHRDLLDVLTNDISAFVGDIIEGKSAGNVILAKGEPGVGKTLTAEVYAELISRPLYCVHSGTLGTTAKEIQKNLEIVFERARAWKACLLLDECDVFVMRRGDNLEQNAIVAEFLRTLEYFDGLMFMTSNRASDIDEAIIMRCAAIIDYKTPGPSDTKAIWRVMSDQFEASLTDALIEELVETFPTIRPRDIKMLLRLAIRVALSQKAPLDIDVFRRCAMFRAIDIKSPPSAEVLAT